MRRIALVFAVAAMMAASMAFSASAFASHEHYLKTPGTCVEDIAHGQTSKESGEGGYHKFHENVHKGTPDDLTDALLFVVPLLLLAGLAGLYLHCRGRLGELERLSLAGFILGSVGLAGASVTSGLWALGLVSEVLIGLWDGLLFVAVGLMLLGGSIIQAGLLGRWKAVPLIVGIIGIPAVAMPPWNFAGVVAWALFGFTWVALGSVLWLGEGETIQRPVRAR